ncbi:MAG TPA: ferritin-like domain-containing protein [Stellaceae bacterium]|nr:ferritin-like domain-containing protein [Stellaceae bacterium]
MTIIKGMAHWTLDDIPWDTFDRSKVDPEIVRIVKAASLVEQNGGDYTQYLCGVFHDDPAFQAVARRWGGEEVQHGQALGRWAMLADPSWDHAGAAERFTAGFRVNVAATRSLRGSRAGELVSRCIVETGTSSYYTALYEAVEEPVLKIICHNIAADELRHYKLFYTHMKRYLDIEGLNRFQRFRIAFQRMRDAEDDELAYAYYAANEGDAPYERRRYNGAYARRAIGVYRWHHVERAIAMGLKAAGLKPHGRLNMVAANVAWWGLQKRAARLERIAA